MIAPLPSCAKH